MSSEHEAVCSSEELVNYPQDNNTKEGTVKPVVGMTFLSLMKQQKNEVQTRDRMM
jgi:hypothetical protein